MSWAQARLKLQAVRSEVRCGGGAARRAHGWDFARMLPTEQGRGQSLQGRTIATCDWGC